MRVKGICLIVFFLQFVYGMLSNTIQADLRKSQMYLEQIQSVLPAEKPNRGRVSPLDATWQDWLNRTGELPPDFDSMPSLSFLPDPLVLDEGRENIPVKTMEQWNKKRQWMTEQIKHWITGTFPPAPKNMQVKILSEQMDGKVTVRMVELRFGPEHKAKMTVELIIPASDGPFPVFMTQWNHRGWALVAVRRGYIGCVYAGADSKDDTEAYADIWYGEYDFTRLMRRAWGAQRVVDYLYTLGSRQEDALPIVDTERIGLTGHSRNGKQSLMAAAFDERIKAVIPSSGGTGAEDPFRYTSEKFDNETIAEITTNFPHWLHPRLRFFVGREHKLPVDQNLLMALVAPRGLMLSSAITEHQGNPWGIEQNYCSVQRVYKFLGAEDKVAIRLRHGRHGTSARDIEAYVDFFDYVFNRTDIEPRRQLYYDYTFSKWLELSGERIDPAAYESKGLDDLLAKTRGGKVETVADWKAKSQDIKRCIRWGLGDEPAGGPNPGPERIAGIPHLDSAYSGDHIARVIGRPGSRKNMNRLVISGYRGFGDYLEGNLYFPADDKGKPVKNNLPAVIYLHEYAYPTGFARRSEDIINGFVQGGYAVFVFDQIGFGTRIEEGTFFYQRYPHWSKMGRMVADTKAAVDALANLEIIDGKRIYVAGYSLGATVGLYSAALDERIGGVVSVCGFTPMRLDTTDKGTEGIRAYCDLHGLLPRLGFFIGNESRIPYDFHEILACIAPRPVLVVAPTWDRYATFDDVKRCVNEVNKVYRLFNAGDKLELYAPEDYNRFSGKIQKEVFEWVSKNFK